MIILNCVSLVVAVENTGVNEKAEVTEVVMALGVVRVVIVGSFVRGLVDFVAKWYLTFLRYT